MNKIEVASKRRKVANLQRDFPTAEIIDLTSKAPEPWVRFSPFYPHGDIPIPLSHSQSAQSVEGIWQGLKVFETAGIDPEKFHVTNMKGLKRTVRRFGPVLGHRLGVDGREIIGYREARAKIYLPAYRWVLDHCLQHEVGSLKELAEKKPLILLDYETNCDVDNLQKPLSHAGLVRLYLLGRWPR